eukprot:CCRYP_009719-RA/>CCRYP_009719-RA protein AED:0.41 eAED:0.43 QI:0/0/0/1/0/0/2/0/276
MGVTIYDRQKFTKQVLEEHLNNKQVYQNITDTIKEHIEELSDCFQDFCDKHEEALGKSVLTFFDRSQLAHGDNIARFWATAKVHKTPIKLRPIVAKVGTTVESVSKWLDWILQRVMKKELPWCPQDSSTFRDRVMQVELPPTARLVTFDAVSMYSNIDLDHARSVMKGWIESYVPQAGESPLPPMETILDALDLVMRHNIMQFGDSYFKQLVGTAMGTSSAVTFANLYFGKHEKDTILPTFLENLKRISFYARFVDDVFLIWNGPCDDTLSMTLES